MLRCSKLNNILPRTRGFFVFMKIQSFSSTNNRKYSQFLNKKYLLIAAGVIIFFFFVILLSSSGKSSNVSQVSAPVPVAKQMINRDFTFTKKDDKGVEIAKVKYTVQTAELDNQIIIKGQTATAITGRIFLIVNLAIVNNTDKDVVLDTRNYIRLSINKSTELLAPDIHNDPVDIQPISTKLTRVGFPINTTDKNLSLQVGEIDGTKQTINLLFNK